MNPTPDQAGEDVREALHAAATSLETIYRLAGRKSYGEPPIETYMDTFLDVRLYAAARARVAREALAALPAPVRGESSLTDEQIDRIWHRMGSFWPNDHRHFARAILAASAPKEQK